MKTSKLLAQGLLKLLSGMLIVGLVLFLPAGSWNYFNGWLFCGLLFLPMLVLGALLLWKAPALLEKRLNTKEQEKPQMAVVAVSSLLFLGFLQFQLLFVWSFPDILLGFGCCFWDFF